MALSENETETITIDDNNESVVIERFLDRDKFPRSTFTEGESKYLQVPRSALMRSPLKNSTSSEK
jgi:hypothetical protein